MKFANSTSRWVPSHLTLGAMPNQLTLGAMPSHLTLGAMPRHLMLGTMPIHLTLGAMPSHLTLGPGDLCWRGREIKPLKSACSGLTELVASIAMLSGTHKFSLG